ncbi:serine protein kinase RIO [Methanolapillus ohkumae]|uniref:non-specific serine/threonine protein kinase n=1 Tax=Methanolapillus ohkumae TaxID=3028298 RepID=A0AA96V6Q5_9EURY|nr:hypothetical protein MsAm2_03130 [Methanosarcinaceae archaeon Am2]
MSQKRIDKQMKKIEDKRDKNRTFKKDSSFLKVEENVFDVPTLKLLYTLSNKGYITEMGGSISTGKEANVFYAKGNEGEVAVKIYRLASGTFKSMDPYILKDPRFTNIRHSRKDIVFAWTKKESQNLIRAKKAGIRVPRPIVNDRNVLVMEFLGKDGNPLPILKDFALDDNEALPVYRQIIEYMRRLYVRAHLVHADLSEYNILIDPHQDETEENKSENEKFSAKDEKNTTGLIPEPIIIDVGQAVTLDHPNAREFLSRDIENIRRFFKKYGISEDSKTILEKIKQKNESDELFEKELKNENQEEFTEMT